MAARLWAVWLILGANEKVVEMDPLRSYLEPTLVTLGEKPKA